MEDNDLNNIDLEQHIIYIAVILTLSKVNLDSSLYSVVERMSRALVNMSKEDRSKFLKSLRQEDTTRIYSLELESKTYFCLIPTLREVNGEITILDTYGDTPLPKQQDILNRLENDKLLRR